MGIFGNTFSGVHLLIIVAVILLLFGAPKLPGLAKSLGQSMRIFKSEVKTMKEEGKDADSDNAGNVDSDRGGEKDDAIRPETRSKP